MKNELVIKKCKTCGTIIKMLEADKEISCCGKTMETLLPNSVDAAVEKHVPTYEKIEDKIIVKVNHVMEKEHYIEWICLVTDKRECMVKLHPGETAEAKFKYVPNSTIYAYCNMHGLWKTEVE